MSWFESMFHLSKSSTNVGQELRAGLATFLTMSYVLLLNPQFLSKVGVPAKDVVVGTALSSAIGSLAAGYFSNMPIGLAPGIGLSAYLTYGMVLGDHLSASQAFTSCFIAGILLILFSLSGVSQIVMKLIPRSVKLATIVGMGLQIALVGMTSVSIVVPNKETIVGVGPLDNYEVWLVVAGLVLIGSLLYHQIQGGILLGIFTMTFITWFITGDLPSEIVQVPNFLAISPTNFISFSDFDLFACLPGICAFIFIGVIDVSGVLFGMASLAQITEPDGSIPGSTAAFLSTAVATTVSALTGGTPVIVYVESAAGIKEGGRTGLTAMFIGVLFLLSLVFAPVLSSIPVTATSPVAILVGAMMMSQATEIDWNNMSEAIPAFLTLIVMPFTFSITNGIVIGLITAFGFYVTTGQIFTDIKTVLYGPQQHQQQGEGVDEDGELGALVPSDLAAENELQALNRPSANVAVGRADSYQSLNGQQQQQQRDTKNSRDQNEDNNFMDFKTFVRTPSLILPKSDADALRKARGMSMHETSGSVAGSYEAAPQIGLDVSSATESAGGAYRTI